jgi:hypothetical protein
MYTQKERNPNPSPPASATGGHSSFPKPTYVNPRFSNHSHHQHSSVQPSSAAALTPGTRTLRIVLSYVAPATTQTTTFSLSVNHPISPADDTDPHSLLHRTPTRLHRHLNAGGHIRPARRRRRHHHSPRGGSGRRSDDRARRSGQIVIKSTATRPMVLWNPSGVHAFCPRGRCMHLGEPDPSLCTTPTMATYRDTLKRGGTLTCCICLWRSSAFTTKLSVERGRKSLTRSQDPSAPQ